MIKKELVTVAVNRTKPFVLTTEKFGTFTLSPEHQDNRLPDIFEFSIEDINFRSVENPGFPSEPVNGFEFRKQTIDRLDYIALDAHCAMAIFQNEKMRRAVKDLWFNEYAYFRSNNRLETLNFLGSMALDETGRLHIISFKYDIFNVFIEVKLMAYEANDKGWFKNDDYAVLFTTEATKRIMRK
ncbi:MAG: hypothetical protein RL641_872 [Candidatus Parcubacteria bacterium]|jgi:hypothetical protein